MNNEQPMENYMYDHQRSETDIMGLSHISSPSSTPSKLVQVGGGVSAGGYEFNELITPGHVTLPVVSFDKHSNFGDGIDYYTAFVPAEAIRNAKLPLDPNPRKPVPNSLVKTGMQVTLEKHPKNFHHWNNGMTIAATQVQYNSKVTPPTMKLKFEKGDGICNGGHTYLAIENFPTSISSDAIVRVEVVTIPSTITNRDEKILNICRFRNLNNKLTAETEANYLGYYEDFKRILGPMSKFYRWYQGDTNAVNDPYDVKHLIRLMGSYDPFWYSHPMTGKKQSHKSAANSVKTPHKQWFDAVAEAKGGGEKDLSHFCLLLPIMLKTMDVIRHDLQEGDYSNITKVWKKTRLWQYAKDAGDQQPLNFIVDKTHALYGKTGFKLPERLEVMLMGSFRTNCWFSVDANGDIEFVGLVRHPTYLWKEHSKTIMQQLHNQMDSCSSHAKPIVSFNALEGCYSIQLAQLEFGNDKNLLDQDPEFLHDVNTGLEYQKEDDPSKATHHLQIIGGKTVKRIEMKSGPSSTSQNYVQL